MYQSMFLEFLVDAPLHLALVLASACGYFVARWATRRFFTARLPAGKPKVCDPELHAEAQEATPKSRKGAKARRAPKANVVSIDLGAEHGISTGQEPLAVPPAPLLASKEEEEEGPNDLPEVEVTLIEEVAKETSTPNFAEKLPKSDYIPSLATPAPVSDRVARLLAKKAERKARQARERLQTKEEEQDNAGARGTSDDAALIAFAQASDRGDISVGMCVEICYKKSDYNGQKGNVVKWFAETAKWGVRLDDGTGLRALPLNLKPCLQAELGSRHKADIDMKVAAASMSEQEEPEFACDSSAASRKLADQDGFIAELSTGDELMCHWRPEATGDECLLDDMEMDAREYCDAFPAGELSQLLCTTHLPSRRVQAPVPGGDPWLAPFDEIIRSPVEARQVYEQLYHDMCSNAGPTPVTEGQYQPVLCENAQKLYTDGQQLYMLACIDVPEDMDMSAPHLMRPVVDVCDPLHDQFAEELQMGLLQKPANDGLQACWDMTP